MLIVFYQLIHVCSFLSIIPDGKINVRLKWVTNGRLTLGLYKTLAFCKKCFQQSLEDFLGYPPKYAGNISQNFGDLIPKTQKTMGRKSSGS